MRCLTWLFSTLLGHTDPVALIRQDTVEYTVGQYAEQRSALRNSTGKGDPGRQQPADPGPGNGDFDQRIDHAMGLRFA
jgi:hypothetical protein